jgi:hypothetical protein
MSETFERRCGKTIGESGRGLDSQKCVAASVGMNSSASDYQDHWGAIRRTQVIRLPLESSSGSRVKSRLIDSAHRLGLGRDLRSCPRMAKTASKLCCMARGANKPKLRMACPYRSGMCWLQRSTNSSGERDPGIGEAIQSSSCDHGVNVGIELQLSVEGVKNCHYTNL